MIRFLLGCLSIGIALMCWNWSSGFSGKLALDRGMTLALWFCVTPTLSTWIVAAIIHRISPRKIFLPGRRQWIAPLLRGVAAGLLGLVIAVFGVAYLDKRFSEVTIMAASSALGALPIVLLSARSKPGLCRRCDYDLRTSLPFGRCPECGIAI